jgi:hypothetical protein
MSSSLRKKTSSPRSPPLDRFYRDNCDYCNQEAVRCDPGSLREVSCILAAILEQLKRTEKERGELK